MDLDELIKEFAPILHFHPEEGKCCCYPSNAEDIYGQYNDDWSSFQETRLPRQLDPATPCYVESWLNRHLTQIRYWFWYNYNDFPGSPISIGKHIGDWEHVEVRLYEGEDPLWLLSNHLESRLASQKLVLPNFNREEPILTERHIHVWVALGSHANYVSPSSSPRCYARVFCDKIAENGEVWYTENGLKPISETNFKSFEGRWGDEKAPRSPLNPYNNRWRNAPDLR